MKTLDQILKSKPVFLNDWKESKLYGVIADFEGIYISKEEYEAKQAPYANVEHWIAKKGQMKNAINNWKNRKVLFASYSYQDYSGDAFVLVAVNKDLFEVNGSHCSCYGLEGQFDMEKIVLKELVNRITTGTFGKGNYCGNEFNAELKKFLGVK